jgi:hypothetical protein
MSVPPKAKPKRKQNVVGSKLTCHVSMWHKIKCSGSWNIMWWVIPNIYIRGHKENRQIQFMSSVLDTLYIIEHSSWLFGVDVFKYPTSCPFSFRFALSENCTDKKMRGFRDSHWNSDSNSLMVLKIYTIDLKRTILAVKSLDNHFSQSQ